MANNKLSQYSINQEFIQACAKGNTKKATALINAIDTKFTPDDRSLNQAVIESYYQGKFNTMKYLLESDCLCKKPNLNYKNNLLFRTIYADNEYELLKYLIFELKIEKTVRIIEELESNPNQYVSRMFLLRELDTDLINNNEIKSKKIKV